MKLIVSIFHLEVLRIRPWSAKYCVNYLSFTFQIRFFSVIEASL